MDAEKYFVIWIVLPKKAAQVFFQPFIVTAQRFQNAQRRQATRRRHCGMKKPACGYKD
jgi:hypothetical protein